MACLIFLPSTSSNLWLRKTPYTKWSVAWTFWKFVVCSSYCNWFQFVNSCSFHSVYVSLWGITGKSKLLLESYLTDRIQRVQLGNYTLNPKTVSTWTKVKHCVPQRSVFGSLFFLLYINDLPNAMLRNATRIFFADDTNILIAG